MAEVMRSHRIFMQGAVLRHTNSEKHNWLAAGRDCLQT